MTQIPTRPAGLDNYERRDSLGEFSWMGADPRNPSARWLIAIRPMTDQRARRIIGGLREPHQTEALRAYTADPQRWLQQNGLLPMGYHVCIGEGPFLNMRPHSNHDTLEAAMRAAETVSIAMSEDCNFLRSPGAWTVTYPP